jgi:hypothetical protein
MTTKIGSFSPNSSTVAITGLTFLPKEIVFRMGPATGVDDTGALARSDGWATLANQSYDVWYRDSTGSKQSAATGSCIRYYRRNGGGTIADVTVGSLASFDTITPGSNYGFTLNFSLYDPAYQIRYKASD